MKKTLLLVALSATFLAAGIFIGYRMADKSKPSWIAATTPAVSSDQLSPVDAYIDECLASKSLLDMASAPTYESATSQERLDLVQDWCQANASQGFNSLSPDDRAFAIRRLKTQLDNLLTERAFDDES